MQNKSVWVSLELGLLRKEGQPIPNPGLKGIGIVLGLVIWAYSNNWDKGRLF